MWGQKEDNSEDSNGEQSDEDDDIDNTGSDDNDGCEKWDISGQRSHQDNMLMGTNLQMLSIIGRQCSCWHGLN
jgi:hypothetical protein